MRRRASYALLVMFSNHDSAGTLWGYHRGQEQSKDKVFAYLMESESANLSTNIGSVCMNWDEWGGDKG